MNIYPLWLSFKVAFIATTFNIIFGVLLATLLSKTRFRGKEFLDAVLTAPLIFPPTVLGYYLLILLGRHSVIGTWWEHMWGEPIVFTLTGAVIAAMIGSLPIIIKGTRSALSTIDPQVIQAARTLGASPVRVWITIELPLAISGITASTMLAFAKSLGDFGITLMVAGNIPKQTQTASLYIYDAVQSGDTTGAILMTVILTCFGVLVLYGVNKISNQHDKL